MTERGTDEIYERKRAGVLNRPRLCAGALLHLAPKHTEAAEITYQDPQSLKPERSSILSGVVDIIQSVATQTCRCVPFFPINSYFADSPRGRKAATEWIGLFV
jgi:hypothetical protein